MYISNEGIFSDEFEPYLSKIGVVPLANDSAFKDLLKKSGKDDPVMKRTQDIFFDVAYWDRAKNWFDTNGFTYPLSMLVIYDSYIHSNRILGFLRKRFIELPPSKGGDEKKWISSYTETRHQWLKHHRREILRKTIYRTQTFLNEISRNNWSLDQLPIIANGIQVS